MSGIGALLVSLHVTANVVWIGAILAVGRTLRASGFDPKQSGSLALGIYKGLAMPAFVVSFVAGALRLALSPGYYFEATHFMHAKLLFALIVIALHHVVGARAKKAANGATTEKAGSPGLDLALVVAAACAVFLAIMKPF
jgi:putative membrane protein